MNICPNCQYENRPGEMICAQCQQPLSQDLRIRTRTIRLTDARKDELGVASEMHAVEVDSEVLLYVSGVNTPVRLDFDEQTILGRIHHHNPRRPDIDLNQFRAFEKGVSCIHAVIYRQDGEIAIADLGSTNGTYLNARRLVPHERQILQNGDEIRLGNLFARIYFSGAP
jgi:hypothetical protein